MKLVRMLAILGGITGILGAQTAPEPARTRQVAFVIAPDAVVIDFAGPWEVFQSVGLANPGMGGKNSPFRLFTVAESRGPVKVGGGMQIVPDYTFENSPTPDVLVVPALRTSKRMLEWLRSASQKAELTMSVCMGASALAEAGLLDGKPAALHHGFYTWFASKYPKVEVKRGVRFVDTGRIASAAGLTSGIDLALHVVDRMLGRETASRTADMLEHESVSWQNPEATMDARWLKASSAAGPESDKVCGMNVPADSKFLVAHGGKQYRFCSEECKRLFAASPGKYSK
jgi:transcriptional regulator GlxA family with amidase domain